MSDWHGYPQHPDAHPERPWWRRWMGPPHARPGESGWLRADGVFTIGDDGYLAARDTAHPLPPPEPRCGQVWVLPDVATHCTVIGVQDGAGYYVDPRGVHRMPWPPPGAVLVAGPGAPWALWEVDDDSR